MIPIENRTASDANGRWPNRCKPQDFVTGQWSRANAGAVGRIIALAICRALVVIGAERGPPDGVCEKTWSHRLSLTR